MARRCVDRASETLSSPPPLVLLSAIRPSVRNIINAGSVNQAAKVSNVARSSSSVALERATRIGKRRERKWAHGCARSVLSTTREKRCF